MRLLILYRLWKLRQQRAHLSIRQARLQMDMEDCQETRKQVERAIEVQELKLLVRRSARSILRGAQ